MTRTQIQFPDPLYKELKDVASKKDWSLAELLRRAAEAYLITVKDDLPAEQWEFPVLRGSGGYLIDPKDIKAEVEAIELKGEV